MQSLAVNILPPSMVTCIRLFSAYDYVKVGVSGEVTTMAGICVAMSQSRLLKFLLFLGILILGELVHVQYNVTYSVSMQ